jgi:hypothetical protein
MPFKVFIAALATAIVVGPLGIRLAMAQSEQTAPIQAAQSVQAPYDIQYEGRVTVRADRTATDVFTKRLKILTPSAVATVSQQQLLFVEGMETLETLEAFTEKSDGTKVPVSPANIITRDAASGLQAIYMRDQKQRTVIFPARRLWSATWSGEPDAEVWTYRPGVPDSALAGRQPWWETRQVTHLQIPILGLDPLPLARWARMVMAMGCSRSPAALLADPVADELLGEGEEEAAAPWREPTAEERIERFSALTSQSARLLVV